jgi:Sec-independent protein translocase protein TatA
MDILGIGGWELVAILVIMLVVAGPKRMIQWSYTLGKYVAMLRKMWAETATMIQKEFDAAGVDVKVPTQPITRGTIKREVSRAFSDVTKPVQETLNEVKGELEPVKESMTIPRTLNKPVSNKPTPTPAEQSQPVEKQNGRPQETPGERSDFGTWGGKADS